MFISKEEERKTSNICTEECLPINAKPMAPFVKHKHIERGNCRY